MAGTEVKWRRGTTAEHATFTGAEGEVTVDTTKDTAVVHDGATAGGRPLLREDLNNLPNDAVTYAKIQNVSATSRALGRKTAGAGDIEELTLSELLDFIGSAAQGDILYRGASAWARLGAGTAGYFLKTQGAGANPMWDAAGGGQLQTELFTSSGTWTVPAGVTRARVTVIGGGGGAGNTSTGSDGGFGGLAVAIVSGLSGSYTVTVGNGGAGNGATGLSGSSSSFGSLVSATGGAGANNGTPGDNGAGTVSSGTTLRLGICSVCSNPGASQSTSITNTGTSAAQTWTTSSIQFPGSRGSGISSGGTAIGGTSGLVMIEYIG